MEDKDTLGKMATEKDAQKRNQVIYIILDNALIEQAIQERKAKVQEEKQGEEDKHD